MILRLHGRLRVVNTVSDYKIGSYGNYEDVKMSK